MQSGELVVIGKDKTTIPLTGLPAEVRCHFVDELASVPCNPHHSDSLEFEIHVSNTVLSGFVLLIKWDVSGVRAVRWHVAY